MKTKDSYSKMKVPLVFVFLFGSARIGHPAIGKIVCVKYDEWADGPALQLVLLLVVCRIDVVADTDAFVSFIHVRDEVTLIAFLSRLQGLYDGRNLLS